MYCYNCMNEIREGEVCKSCFNQGVCEPMPHHLRPGQILNGKYLVGNCIGEGGFGITYVGKDMVLDIKVAIKEFFPNGYVNRNNCVTQMVTATTEEQKDFFNKGKDRFLAEAKNIAKFIDEPGVVGVREYFEANGTAYIIMEYLDGINLSKYIRVNGKMAPDTIFKLMLPIMSSLQRVHEAGIIHRDISPDNIMYMKNGTLKLMDFGSARYFTNEEKEMSIMLKQGYAPEEQYRKNSKQGPWTDVYGLCATMYRCITGVVPDDALDRMHQDNLKKPADRGVAISPALQTILMCGLAVHMENRYKNMKELRESVEKVLFHNEPVTVAASIPQVENRTVEETIGVNFTYGDNFTRQHYEEISPAPKNNKTGTIIGILLIIATLVFAIGAFVYFVLPMINEETNNDTKLETTTQVEETKPTETKAKETKPDTITVPDVTDMTFEKAMEELIDCGFKVEHIYVPSSDVENDHVIRQYPTPDSKAEKGATITLYLAENTDDDKDDKSNSDKDPEDMTTEDIDKEVEKIRGYYYNNTAADTWNYVEYGEGNLDYTREYMLHNGKVVFALVYNGVETHRYYLKDDTLIRYIDEDGTVYDYDDLTSNHKLDEARIVEEAYS